MKKFIFLLLAFLVPVASFAGLAANTFSSSTIPYSKDANTLAPKDYVRIQLGPCVSGAYDTIGATYSNYYGPYSLSADFTRPHFVGMRCLTALSTLGATCTTGVDYQIIGGKTWADTAKAGWVSFDSIKAAAGNSGTYTHLDTLMGMSIVFKLHCLTHSSTAIIAKPVYIFFKSKAEDIIDTKK